VKAPLVGDDVAALLFDLDGTLVDSYEAIHESLCYALGEKGLAPLDYPTVRRMVGRGLEVLIGEAMGEENVADGVTLFRSRYRQVFLQKTRLLPGVEAALARLHGAGRRLAVCSNKPGYFSTDILAHLGVGHRFSAVLGPEHTRLPKPDPEMLHIALARLEVPARQALYVGDMPMDVDVARAAGVRVAVVPTGSATRGELEAAAPDLLVDELAELVGAIA